ncbi:hypothetical protein CC80DRAFT_438437 [Byssothecium circinans]|uniref:Uncharacterized protein n=1 Tax=Byssothecium circinans TaxID=147558 RepID=A0A6A5U6R0_9PLEO|nr:hypothetical protein CC80DRAFT_438437 [Byssothecium circinans]
MPRTIYLAVFNSPIFPAHWALWIPRHDNENVGKLLQANGDAATGFEICFERNYDISADSRRHQIVSLGQAQDDFVDDFQGNGALVTGQKAHDRLEEVALSVPPPKPSLLPATAQGPRRRVEIQNCQTWARNVVAALVQNGVLSGTALEAVENAPKN